MVTPLKPRGRTSSRQKQDGPIESVSLRITFTADKDMSDKIRRAIPGGAARKGGYEIEIEADGPQEVAEKAKQILEKIRAVV